uniref:Uncharacterized protein n=1 Tax=Zea mays TaxID=4577 RepID=C0HHH0_MAIZE|nr:unknown [Zea mays]
MEAAAATTAAALLPPARKVFILPLLLLLAASSLVPRASSDGAQYDYRAYTECKPHPEPALYNGGVLRWASKITDFRTEDEGNYSPAFVLYNMSAATAYSFSSSLLHCLHLSRLGENRRARKRTREGEDTDRGERSVAVRRHRYRAQRLLVFSQGWLYSQLHVSNLGALFADCEPKCFYDLNQKPLLAAILTRSVESAQGGAYPTDSEAFREPACLRRQRQPRGRGGRGRAPDHQRLPLRLRHQQEHPRERAVPGLVQRAVQRGGVRERAQVVRDGAVAGEGGVRGGGPAAAVRAVQRRDGARAQHLLGGPQVHAGVGEEPDGPGAARRGGRPRPEPAVAVQGRLRALGREQRDAALRLLRGPAGRQRHGRLLQHGQARRPAGHALPQRLQRGGGVRRPQLQRRLLRVQAAPARRRRRGHLRGHRAGGPLRQAQRPLRARRARQAGHAPPARLAHRGRRQRRLRPRHAGRVPRGRPPRRLRAPGRRRHRAVDGHGRQRHLLPDVPHGRRLHQPPGRRRRRQAAGGVADQGGAGRHR